MYIIGSFSQTADAPSVLVAKQPLCHTLIYRYRGAIFSQQWMFHWRVSSPNYDRSVKFNSSCQNRLVIGPASFVPWTRFSSVIHLGCIIRQLFDVMSGLPIRTVAICIRTPQFMLSGLNLRLRRASYFSSSSLACIFSQRYPRLTSFCRVSSPQESQFLLDNIADFVNRVIIDELFMTRAWA